MPLKKKLLTKKPTDSPPPEQHTEIPQAIRVFAQFGLEIPKAPNGSGQYVCDCIFCDKPKHFFLTPESKKFKGEPAFICKSCSIGGNKYTFLKAIYEMMLANSAKGSYTRLGLKRKMKPDFFSQGGVAFSPEIHRWVLPTKTKEGGISNLHTYDGNNGSPLIAATGCQLHLIGLDGLKPTGPVYICEGHWDRMSLLGLLNECQKQPENISVLAVPGAGTLPEADIKLLAGCDVYLLYDNDEPGYNGMKYAVGKLSGIASAIHVLEWPPNRFREGFDVTDLVREAEQRPDATAADLISWCHQTENVASVGPAEEMIPKLVRNTFEEVVVDFKETGIYMYPGLKDALAITLAVIESIRFSGEPLWMYMIGVSGAGKSLILESTLASREVLYRTAITHRSLLSGFNGEDDPSLLAKLPGRSLVVKDYSNVLALPHFEQDLLFSILREAYDGRVYRDYGNGVIRQYPPPDSPHEDCRFSFVAGVTPEIYARNNSALGERFLRFHIPRTGSEDLRAIEVAMDDSWRTHQQGKRRAAAVAGFLSRASASSQEKTPPVMPEWYKHRIIALAQFVGYCRSVVSRTKEDLDYDPAIESGTRMSKQLKKLSLSLCRILGKTSADKEVYRLVRKVAWDTAHGWRRKIYSAIRKAGEGETSTIVKLTGYSHTTVHRQLRDMHALGVLKKGQLINPKDGGGRPKQTYLLSQRALEIYDTAQIGEV